MSESDWSSDGRPFELRLYPDPILKRRGVPIVTIDQGIRDRVRRMFEIMYDEGGIGLAAPQVGWTARVFVINLSLDRESPDSEIVFINPKIELPTGSESEEEGCLSFPELRIPITRPESVKCTATGLDGEPFELDATGLLARCIQHELDHLEGVLFVDRAGFGAKVTAKKVLKALEREYKESRDDRC